MHSPLPPLPTAVPEGYPPHRPVSSDVARQLDQEAEAAYGVPSLVLMEHASRGVAGLAWRLAGPGGRIVVLCGPGNNGGDGYGAARFLASWGAEVRILRCSRRTPGSPDAAQEVTWSALDVEAEDAWSEQGIVIEALENADVAVDALFGVGLDRDLDPPYPALIEALNAADVVRLAVDVPSGLDADSGEARPVAVRAHVTATMAMPKTGLVQKGAGRAHSGQVIEVDIGLPGPVHRTWLADLSGR